MFSTSACDTSSPLRQGKFVKNIFSNSADVLLAATVVGGVTAAGQVLLLRELLALFSGFELAAAALLAGWLLWSSVGSLLAGFILGGGEARARTGLAWLLPLLGILVPASLFATRAAPLMLQELGVPLGLRPSLGALCGISLVAPAPFCLVGGALFAAAWKSLARGTRPPLQIYLAESLGAAGGGLLVYAALAFLLLEIRALDVALGLCGLAVFVGVWLLLGPGRKMWRWLAALVLGLAFAPLFLQEAELELSSLRWRWGPDAVASRDTPSQRVVLLQRQGERSYFGGSGWLFTVPDPRHAEWATQPALLAHPEPRSVLLLGGNPYALVRESLKQPTVKKIVFLEPDNVFLDFLQQTLPKREQEVVGTPGTRVLREDPVPYVRGAREKYDVVLLNAGEPLNSQVGRLYSLEFFRDLQGVLAPGGLFGFSVPASPEALGPAQEEQLRSLYATAAAVFGQVRVVLGGTACFFCSDAKESLPLDASELTARLARRDMVLHYVREDTLDEFLSPFRQGYVKAVLEEGDTAELNRVLRPVSYAHSAMLWLRESKTAWARDLAEFFAAMGREDTGRFSPLFYCAVGVAALLALLGRIPKYGVPACVAMGGAGGMALELGLLLAFQGLAGSLYSRLALLVGAWMSGLGLGAWLVHKNPAHGEEALRRLALTQGALALLMAAAGPLFVLMLGAENDVPWLVVFTLLCLSGGACGGAHFGLATQTLARGGATLYAMDLAGAAVGVLVAGLFLTPLLGVGWSLSLFALVLGGGCLGLWRGRPLRRLRG